MQKCDAGRPCSKCIKAKSVSECVYDDEKHLQQTSMCSSRRADDRLSRQPTGPDLVEAPIATPSHSPSDGAPTDAPPPARLNLIPSISSDASRVVTNEPAIQQVFGADQVPHGQLVLIRRDPLEPCVPLDTSPSASAVSSCFLPTIPPELRMTLSFLGEEKLQVQLSETDAADLVMTACVLQMGDHRPQAYPQILVGCGVWFVYPSWGYNSAVKKWTR
jgi:hypothetical protein